MNSIKWCSSIFYNDTFGIVHVLSILSTQNIAVIATLSTLPLPSTIDDDGCKSSSDLSSSSTCFSGAFGAIPPATNTAEERGRRKGERGMLTPNIPCSKTPRTPLFWRRHGHGRWWSIVDRFEEVCWLLPASKEGREERRSKNRKEAEKAKRSAYVIQRSRQMTSYGTVAIRSDSADVIYFTFVGDVEETKERINRYR